MENNSFEYELKQNIGSGAFGNVYLAYITENRQIAAAKIFNTFNNEQDIIDQIKQEICVISKINHPLILKYIWSGKITYENTDKYAMFTEFYPNGNLRDILNLSKEEQEKIGWNDTKKLISIYTIAVAMSYLHEKNIIHRDLKPENILMDKYLHPIISDFGQAKIVDSIKLKLSKFVGSPLYLSPEIMPYADNDYDKSVDVFAFGIIVYEIIVKSPPYDNCTSISTLFQNVTNGQRPKIPENVSEIYMDLMERCWSQKPSNRYTFNEIIGILRNSDILINQNDKKDFEVYIQYIDQFMQNYDQTNEINPIESFINHDTNNFNILELKKYQTNDNNIDYYSMGLKFEYGDENTAINKEKAVECYKNAAIKGNVDAMCQIGYILAKGDGIEKNINEAFRYFQKAAISGKVDAMYQCYLMYVDNSNISREDALFYLEMAADSGNLDAIFEYAMKYLYGKDPNKALTYLKIGADNGSITCMMHYAGLMYGLNNKKEAFEYYQKAADLKNKDAMLFVANMLKLGDGIRRNIREANRYFDQLKPKLQQNKWYILDSLDDFQIIENSIIKNNIRKGKVKSTGQLIVEKRVNGNNDIKIKQECEYLVECCYPSIQKVIGLYSSKDKNETSLLTYYYENSSLDNFISTHLKEIINEKRKFDDKDSIYSLQYQILYGICDAMKYLEQKKMFHGDLNPTNILINENEFPILNNIKMKSHYTNEEINNTDLMINYFAPEVILGHEVTIKSDVFSFGLIMNEIFSGIIPHSLATSRKEIIENITKEPEISPKVPNFLIDILKNCLKIDPKERDSFEKILSNLDNIFNYDFSPIDGFKKEINGKIQCPITFFRAPTIIVSPPKKDENGKLIFSNLLLKDNLEKVIYSANCDTNIKIVMVYGKYQSGKSTFLRTLTGNGGFFSGKGLESTTHGILIDGPYNGNEIINRIGSKDIKMISEKEEIVFQNNPAIFFIDSQGVGDEHYEESSSIMFNYLSFFCAMSDLCINITPMNEHYKVSQELFNIIRTGQIVKQRENSCFEPNEDGKIKKCDAKDLSKIIFLIRDYSKINKKHINNKFQFIQIQNEIQNDWNSNHKKSNSKYFEDNIKIYPVGNLDFDLQTYNYTIWNIIPEIVSILNSTNNNTKDYIQAKTEDAYQFLFSEFFTLFNNKSDSIDQITNIANQSLILVNNTIMKYKQKIIGKEETIDSIIVDFLAIKYFIIPFTIGVNLDKSFNDYNQYILDLMKDIMAYVGKSIPELRDNLFLNFKEILIKEIHEINFAGAAAAGGVPVLSTIGANLAKQFLIQLAETVVQLSIPGGVIVSIISVFSFFISAGSFLGVFFKNCLKNNEKVNNILTQKIPLGAQFLWNKVNNNSKLITVLKSPRQINGKIGRSINSTIIAIEKSDSNFMKFIIQCMTGLETNYKEKSENKKESILYGPFKPNELIQRYSRCYPNYISRISDNISILYLKGFDANDLTLIENSLRLASFFISSTESDYFYPIFERKSIYMFSMMNIENTVFLQKKNLVEFKDQNKRKYHQYNIIPMPIVMNNFNDFDEIGSLNNKCLRWSFNQILQRKKVDQNDHE